MVVGGSEGDPLAVGTVLETGSEVTAISVSLVEKLESKSSNRRIVYPFPGGATGVRVADGTTKLIDPQTRQLQVSIYTPRAQVVLFLACAMMPGNADALIIGAKTERKVEV